MLIKKPIIGIASDHAGYLLKEVIKNRLSFDGYILKDYGTDSSDSCDYPEFAHCLADAINNCLVDIGIAICGTGEGMSMTLNKHQNIRCALCWNPDIAKLARQHNNANALALPARFISDSKAIDIVRAFILTEFEGGRHQRRIDKIPCNG